MVKRVTSIWNLLICLGVSSSDSEDTKRRLYFLNRTTLIISSGGIPYFLLFYFSGFRTLSYLIIPFVLSYLLCLYLNKHRFHTFSRVWLVLATSFSIFVFSNILGIKSGIHLVTVAIGAISLDLFPSNQRRLSFAAFLIPVFVLLCLELTAHHPWFPIQINFPAQYLRASFFISELTSFFIVFVTFSFYISLNQSAEKKLIEYNHNLLSANQSLETALQDLKESQQIQLEMKTQTEFARLMRQVAHEVKNPLHLIGGNAQIMQTKGDSGTEQDRRSVRAIIEAVARIDKLLNAMMRYGDSRKGFKPEYVNVRKVLEGIRELAYGECKKKYIEIEILCEVGLRFYGDDTRIGQAMINLIANAVQYTPERGRITLSAELASYKSPKAPHEQEEGVCISVTDTGCGIPKDKLEAIFSPGLTSKQAEHNYGMGLAIVFQTLLESKGRVEVDSEVGKGTRFKLYVPAKKYETVDDEKVLIKGMFAAPEQVEVYELPEWMRPDR